MYLKKSLHLLIFLMIFSIGSIGNYAYLYPTSLKGKNLTIGIVLDGKWEKNQEILSLFKKEIIDLLGKEYSIQFPEKKTITGDWTVKSIRSGLEKLLKDKETDIIITMGISASHEASHIAKLIKPVLAPFVIDEKLQNLPRKDRGSGVENLNYLVSISKIEDGIKQFQRIVPFKRVTILIPAFIRQEHTHITNNIDKISKIKPNIIWVDKPIENTIKKLNKNIQGLYIVPMLNFTKSETKKLIDAANKLKIPTFSHIGELGLEQGVMAASVSRSNYQKLARRIALNIQRILMGEKAGSLPVEFQKETQLIINMKTAGQIGIYPNWEILTEAELIHEEETTKQSLSLIQAVNNSISSNLELLIKQTEVQAGRQDIRIAAAKLLPQLSVSGTYLKIDNDRANASMGNTASNSLYGSASLTQVIYSEEVLANIKIQKHIQLSRKAQLEQLRLDIGLLTAEAYINVLRMQALEKVQKNNMKITKYNLNLAKVRKSLGASDSSEVYRWEAQYANSRRDFLDAQTQRNLAEIQLNRIQNKPLEKKFKITQPELKTSYLDSRKKSFYTYVDNPYTFKFFIRFMVDLGLKNAPELKQLDAAIASKKRFLKSRKNKFFVPILVLKAGIDNYFSKTGAGTSDRDLSAMTPAFSPVQIQALASLFPNPANDLNWNVALNLSLPLFSGGEKIAEKKKVAIELEQLQKQRRMVAEKLTQRIHSTIHQAAVALAKVPLSRQAAEASSKTLEMVTDAYSQGAVSILNLLDAQNAALIMDRASANASYDFLQTMFNVQRAVNQLSFLTNKKQQIDILHRFEKYLKDNSVLYKVK